MGMLGTEHRLTKLFAGVCVLVFVAMVFEDPGGMQLSLRSGFRVSTTLKWGALWPGLGPVEPWRYASAMFVHVGGVLHVAFNTMALVDLGKTLEERVGSARFTIIFLLTGIVGFIASDLWSGAPTGGASGGIFGLAGALVGYLYAAKDPHWKRFLIRLLVYALVFALVLPVNNAAHAGGLVLGGLLGYLSYLEARRGWRRHRVFRLAAVLLAVACLASIPLSVRSPVWQQVQQLEWKRAERDALR